MATYLIFSSWTQQGIQSAKEAPARLDAAKQAAKAAGGEIKATYLVTGEYDLVNVVEAPNDETLARLLIVTGMQGNLRTKTVRAFTEDEFRRIIASLP
jgi:uncharacterized protein with GYD domain